MADGPGEFVILRNEEPKAISVLLIDGTGLGPCAAAGGAQQVAHDCQGLYVHLCSPKQRKCRMS